MKRVDDKLGFDSADLVAFVLMVLRLRAEEMLDHFMFLKKIVGRQITKSYCTIHLQVLSSNVLKSGRVIWLAILIVTHLRFRELKHGTFRGSLEEVDAEYRDLISHTEVSSSSLRRMGQRIIAQKEEVVNYF
jgi:hypothetical protein